MFWKSEPISKKSTIKELQDIHNYRQRHDSNQTEDFSDMFPSLCEARVYK